VAETRLLARLGEDPVEPGTVAYLDFQKLPQITIEATIVGRGDRPS